MSKGFQLNEWQKFVFNTVDLKTSQFSLLIRLSGHCYKWKVSWSYNQCHDQWKPGRECEKQIRRGTSSPLVRDSLKSFCIDSWGILKVLWLQNMFWCFFNRSGIQQRRVSWQDGLAGTNCPIPPKWNWTYEFQVKDQIGSFFYFPSLHFQRASGGFGSFIVNPRSIIPVPFSTPEGDITIAIGDWYTRNHTVSTSFFLSPAIIFFTLQVKQ